MRNKILFYFLTKRRWAWYTVSAWTDLLLQFQMNKNERVKCASKWILRNLFLCILIHCKKWWHNFSLRQVWKRLMDFKGPVWKRVWKMTIFRSEMKSGLGELGGNPHHEFPRILGLHCHAMKNKKCKPFNTVGLESGKWKKKKNIYIYIYIYIYIQKPLPRIRSVKYFKCEILGKTVYLNL